MSIDSWLFNLLRVAAVSGSETRSTRPLLYQFRFFRPFPTEALVESGDSVLKTTEVRGPLENEERRYLIRDRDGTYSPSLRESLKIRGVEEVLTAPRSPRENPYVERQIGSIRWECLDHMIVLHEAHLRRILSHYFDYYHNRRTHHALDDNAPNPHDVELLGMGRVLAISQVGGLHHRYARAA
jgi:Integrase core domain